MHFADAMRALHSAGCGAALEIDGPHAFLMVHSRDGDLAFLRIRKAFVSAKALARFL